MRNRIRTAICTILTAGVCFQSSCSFDATRTGFAFSAGAGAGTTPVRVLSSPFPGIGFIAAVPDAGVPFSTP